MKFAQLKLIGVAILATSLSAGGVVAVSYAAGQSPEKTPNTDGAEVNAAKPAGQADTRSLTLPIQVSPSAERAPEVSGGEARRASDPDQPNP